MLRKQNSSLLFEGYRESVDVSIRDNVTPAITSVQKSANYTIWPVSNELPFSSKLRRKGSFNKFLKAKKEYFFLRQCFVTLFMLLICTSFFFLSVRMSNIPIKPDQYTNEKNVRIVKIDSDLCFVQCMKLLFEHKNNSENVPRKNHVVCAQHCRKQRDNSTINKKDRSFATAYKSTKSGETFTEEKEVPPNDFQKSDRHGPPLNRNHGPASLPTRIKTNSPSLLKILPNASDTIPVRTAQNAATGKILKKSTAQLEQQMNILITGANETKLKKKVVDDKGDGKGSNTLLLDNSLSKLLTDTEEKSLPMSTPRPRMHIKETGNKVVDISYEVTQESQDTYRSLLQDESVFLWLSGDRNVETTSTGLVKKWTDLSNTHPRHVFIPTPEKSHFTEIFGHENHRSLKGEPMLEFVDGTKNLSAIKFPCSLESKGSQIPNDTPLSLFFVVQPDELKLGVTVEGQRFFGHYPNGQFRFSHSSPSIFSRGDLRLQHLYRTVTEKKERHHLGDNELIIVKYRIDNNGVHVGLNEGNYYQVSEVLPEFSQNGKLTVGGVNGGCGFRGKIAEIIIFTQVLNDKRSETIVKYLSKKWFPEKLTMKNHEPPKEILEQERTRLANDIKPEHVRTSEPLCDNETAMFQNPKLPYNKDLSIWLRADAGVKLLQPDERKVESWTSLGPAESITFTSPARFHPKLRSRIHSGYDKDSSYPLLAYINVPTDCLPVMSFTCGIIAENYYLKSGLTIFLAIMVQNAELKEHRIMGHFPNGGLLMFNGKPLFKTKAGHLGKDSQTVAISETKQISILKYRFSSSGIEVGINDKKLTKVGFENDIVFSRNGKLTVGGTNGECGFTGMIGEIIVFNTAIRDTHEAAISEYLMNRWQEKKNISPTGLNSDKIAHSTSKNCYPGDFYNNHNIFTWMPSLELGEQYHREAIQWNKIVREQMKLLRHQETDHSSSRFYLETQRLRIFGEPCSNSKAYSNKEKSIPSQQAISKNSGHVTKETTKTESKRCMRPYNKFILEWTPPTGAPKALLFDWSEKVREMRLRIARFQKGGDELRNLLRGISREMNVFRDTLFGNICDDNKEATVAPRNDTGFIEGTTSATSVPIVEKPTIASVSVDCKSNAKIIEWNPPEGAPEVAILDWKELVQESRRNIAAFNKGGDALTKFLRTLGQKLEKDRNRIFGKLCNHNF